MKTPIYKNPKCIVPLVVALIAACATLTAAMIGILPDLSALCTKSTPVPTLAPTPTLTREPTKTIETSRPTSQAPGSPSALGVEELWPVGTECHLGGRWSADLRVLPEGGSGAYDYYVDGVWKGSSGAEGVTIRLDRNACTAIVGTLTVKSGGQIVSQEFWISVPECCGK